MIACKLLLCAQGVIRDAEHGSISVFNIMEGYQSAGFPFFLQQMDIVGLFERGPNDDPKQTVTFKVSVGDNELVNKPLDIDFLDKRLNRSVLHVNGLVIPQPGILNTEVSVNGETLDAYHVTFDLLPSAKAGS